MTTLDSVSNRRNRGERVNPRTRLIAPLFALGLFGFNTSTPSSAQGPQPEKDGSGWAMTQLDLDIRVLPDEERMEMNGTVRLRLDKHDSSYGPHLLVNMKLSDEGVPVMRFVDVACEGAEVKLPSELRSGGIRQAKIRFDRPKSQGDEITVSFSTVSEGVASQLFVQEQFAVASWTAGWHPFTNSTVNPKFTFNAGILHAPGRTRLHLPADWIGIVDGALIERTSAEDGTVEVWDTPEGIARGFAAGPLSVVTERVDGRELRIYMRSEDKPLGPKRFARLIADSMAAQEARLGPFPFASYAVVEAPESLPGQNWLAASQQSFILARSSAFDQEDGNLPLWAHEMAHGWWGNTVGSRGPGSIWCDESLAWLCSLISLEAIEGPEAMHEFLAFARDGSAPVQCAAGYFMLLRQGHDRPLAKLSQDPVTDVLADSKGMWVYHMLRQAIGDELFFGVLRGVLADLAHGSVSVVEMRRRFVAAAPEHDLETFFAQWMDRTGAPILDVDWYAGPDGGWLALNVTQTQEGEPFVFNLDVEVQLADGQGIVEQVEVSDTNHTFVIDVPARASDIRLDPEYKLLLWRPEYGPRPGDEFTGGSPVSDEVLAAVVGNYRAREMDKTFDVYLKDGVLFILSEGAPELRLLYKEGGVFQLDVPGDPIVTEFDMSVSPSPSFKVTAEGEEHIVERVDR